MKKILFVCEGNATRSQIAEGFVNNLSSNIEARSAGILPAGFIAKKAIEAMNEKGIDLSKQSSKAVTQEDLEWADLIITVCESNKRLCNLIPTKKKIINWDVEDPRGKDLESYREVRDMIETRVKQLISNINRKL